jgi:hypothetical protein
VTGVSTVPVGVKVGIGVKASVELGAGIWVRLGGSDGARVAVACAIGLDWTTPAGVDGARNGTPGRLGEQAARHMPRKIRIQRARTLLMVVPVLALRDAAQQRVFHAM